MLANASRLQSFISWDNFSHGFLAVSWQTQQQQYYNNRQLWGLSTKWASKVLKWILKMHDNSGTTKMMNYTDNN